MLPAGNDLWEPEDSSSKVTSTIAFGRGLDNCSARGVKTPMLTSVSRLIANLYNKLDENQVRII